ncbi:hypothetical protein GOBAR_AA13647 [Gossypium barbadense]|uniref:Uncharacterized protein n=1 Tax=Gossypium barbadense TaxID=3634 RepID=A0A2P5XUH2_GOSBA|nr:hypothetical protein GOBAR_AA13647 [Gossypium barbadense]
MRKENTPESCLNNDKGPIYEERRLQIEELDEWQTHKLRAHDKPKPRHDELNILPNQLKIGDKVLLDAADPRIATSEPNRAIPLMVLSIFPYGTVEVIHPKFDTFKLIAGMRSVNSSHHHDHATERFSNPHGWAQRCSIGRAHTTGGETIHGRTTRPCPSTVIKTDKIPRVWISIHGRERSERSRTRPCDTVVCTHTPKEHGHALRPCTPKSIYTPHYSSPPSPKSLTLAAITYHARVPITAPPLTTQSSSLLCILCQPHVARRPPSPLRRKGKEQRHPWVLPLRSVTLSSSFFWDPKRNYFRYYGPDP